MSESAAPGLLPWGRSLVTVAGVFLALGLTLGVFPYLILATVLAAAAFAHRALPAPRIRLERHLSSPQVRAGDAVEVRHRIEWSGGRGAATVHDAVPDAFRLADGRNFDAVVLDGSGASERAFSVEAPRRGVHRVGPATAVVPDPLGAGAARVVPLADDAEIVVQASAPNAPRLRSPAAWGVTMMPGGDRASRGTTTNDFRELRPYAPGDPLKSVNWKATARASTRDVNLIVNEYEVEGKKAVWVFLDASSYTRGGKNTWTRFDDLAHGALGVARHFLDRGHRVGFTIYGGAEPQVLHPDHGSTQERRIVNLLTFAEPTEEDGLGLGAAVERTRGFMARERPLTFVFTLIGRDATLERGVTEARALSSTGRRPGTVVVLAPATRADGGLPGRIVAVRERLQSAALSRMGVRVATWDDETRPLGALLAHGVMGL